MSTPSPLPCPSLLFQWAAVIIINILLLLFRIFAPPSPSPLQPRNALWKNSRKAGHGKNTLFIFPLYEFLECMILLFSLGNCCDDAIFRPGYQTTSCFPLSPLTQSPKPPVSQKLRTRDRRFASPTFFRTRQSSNWQKFKTGREDRKPRSVVMRKYGEGERKEKEFQFAADRVEELPLFFCETVALGKNRVVNINSQSSFRRRPAIYVCTCMHAS